MLAAVQGLAELLPVSSSAHVVIAEKLMGLDPSAPDMTLLRLCCIPVLCSPSLCTSGIDGELVKKDGLRFAPGIPDYLAGCFAWHVTQDRDE